MIALLRSARMRPRTPYASALERGRIGALAALSLVGLALSACQSGGVDGEDASAEAEDAGGTMVQGAPAIDPARQMAVMSELQSIEASLTPFREQAMADPELQAKEAALYAQVEAAMREIYPGMDGAEARFDSLRAEFETARAAQDSARVQALGAELQTLQMSVQQTQMQALQQEDVAAALEAFRGDLFAAMRELDPKADSLIDRAEALNDELEAAAGN